ncbi:MAG: ATP-binding protein [Actinomycetota bacterium]|nr:ATP-binding protein [Actinomycetota bacterium]
MPVEREADPASPVPALQVDRHAASWDAVSDVTAPDQEAQHPYTMRLSLSVVDHLGLNLYSNIPAVLSEVVANAWDADAEHVEIVIDAESRTISVTDDVGYKRREAGSSGTARGRRVMGRKGIGKLSLFAIADTVRP